MPETKQATSANVAIKPAGDPRLTVYVVEDDLLDRDFLTLFLGRRGYQVQCFPSAETFLSSIGPDAAGCVLADFRLTGMTGTELVAEAQRRGVEMPFVISSAYGDINIVRQAFHNGAIDFLEKPVDVNLLFSLIDKSFVLDAARLDRASRTAQRDSLLEPLTDREKEVAVLACQGISNRDIALQLNISHRTVEAHKSRVIDKLGARTSADLIRMSSLIEAPRRSD